MWVYSFAPSLSILNNDTGGKKYEGVARRKLVMLHNAKTLQASVDVKCSSEDSFREVGLRVVKVHLASQRSLLATRRPPRDSKPNVLLGWEESPKDCLPLEAV